MRKAYRRYVALGLIFCLMLALVACGSGKDTIADADKESADEASGASQEIVIGFSQLGAESDWRAANSASMKSAFTPEKGYNLLFEDGQQKQANQMTAIRRFIQQEVDYIVLAPVTETGWDTALEEARDAGIPVIIVDRMVDTKDPSLYTCWVGSDFKLEGDKAAEWLHAYAETESIAPEDLHIVNIQGTIGATAQIGRTNGLRIAAAKYGWDLMEEIPGEFTQTKGREAMETLLSKYDNINVVYCENDNSAFGAIEAIEAQGKKVGSDIKNGEIMVISFDGVNSQAMEYVRDDKISCLVECNPLHGPRIYLTIENIQKGVTPDKHLYVDEEIFSSVEGIDTITVGDTEYTVEKMTDEVISNREDLFASNSLEKIEE